MKKMKWEWIVICIGVFLIVLGWSTPDTKQELHLLFWLGLVVTSIGLAISLKPNSTSKKSKRTKP